MTERDLGLGEAEIEREKSLEGYMQVMAKYHRLKFRRRLSKAPMN